MMKVLHFSRSVIAFPSIPFPTTRHLDASKGILKLKFPRPSWKLTLKSSPLSTRRGSFCRRFGATACVQTETGKIEGLPPKLENIVKLFESVNDPRSKYEQLLHYGRQMKPLEKQYQTSENKVEGCVSQVWVRAFINGNRVFFEADSDSVLTKGLAALLVEGLSGCTPSEILKLSPDFIQTMGLKQSLTPSRNNGFLNMLRLMQRKTLQLYMEGESGLDSTETQDGTNVADTGKDIFDKREEEERDSGSLMKRAERIRDRLEREVEPMALEIEDVSHQHAGHAAVQGQSGETHYNIKVVSSRFEGMSLVKRHRFVYDLLNEELQSGLHALSIQAKTPAEMENL
eukprot:TRINITY_DN6079_c0_g2_i1.p1 TRINITY_DN6079_c0_g2~~TRINITY_DN6079_c0_g2_i1.p1  ORF type:complete len:343 (-),score=67.83 TRINITY_DN6079_c0_g2_i1:241-1269(-)